MKKNYRHLSAEERAVIMIAYGKDASVGTIARLLGRSASTVLRELARNRDGSRPGYDATRAASASHRARSRMPMKLICCSSTSPPPRSIPNRKPR